MNNVCTSICWKCQQWPKPFLDSPFPAPTSDGDSSQTTTVGQIPSGSRQGTATCLEAVRSSREVRFSRETAERIATLQASSIKSIYDKKWHIIVLGVVDGKQILPLALFPWSRSSSPHLFQDKQLAPGMMAAIASAFRHTGLLSSPLNLHLQFLRVLDGLVLPWLLLSPMLIVWDRPDFGSTSFLTMI